MPRKLVDNPKPAFDLSLKELKTIYPNFYVKPKIHKKTFIAKNATVLGNVEIGEGCGIWYNTVLRGDVNFIKLGNRTNIQDLSMIHVSFEGNPCIVGDDTTVGHSVVLHACTIGNHVLVGMGSTILDGAVIEDYVLLGAGSLVTENTRIPTGMKAFGRPAKVVGPISQAERDWIEFSSYHYQRLAKAHLLRK